MGVIQYPHTVNFTGITDSHMDANGNWINTGSYNLTIQGRAEPASANGLIAGPDGILIKYAWVIYLPLPINPIPVNTTVVSILNGSEFVGKGKVVRFSKGQFNARIWL